MNATTGTAGTVDLRPAPGVSVIQASAGTGKTHVVTSLATVAIAEGRSLTEMLLVTFSRAATGELRSRVWRRLVDAEADLARALATGTAPTDEVSAELCGGPDADVDARHQRLRAAVANFDAITIATLHSFCHDVLSRLGFIGDLDREITFLEDDRALSDQVVDDLLVRRFHRSVDFQLSQDDARRIARAVTTHSHATIVPEHSLEARTHYRRARFARAIKARIDERKRELRVLSYDDLLARLDDALDGDRRDAVRRRLQERFSFVVVDEFQDTDTVQWRILDRGFGPEPDGTARTTMVLVGDPKQAIYAFRGADLEAYLAARRHDPSPTHLGVNWRSDAGLLRALDTLFGTARLGHDEIGYERTTAAPHHTEGGLVTTHKPEPLRIRQVWRDRFAPDELTPRGAILLPAAAPFVADDAAADIRHRLANDARIETRRPDGTAAKARPVQPRDIAVLVRRHAEAELVRDALARLGIPAVVNGTSSVFATDATDEWLTLLAAIESPAATTLVHRAVLTNVFGWTGERLAIAADDEWDAVHDQLHHLREVLADRGPAAVLAEVATATDLPARVLATTGGQRFLTDLEHIGRLLHDHAATADAAPATLIGWLRERQTRQKREQDIGDRQRQLDTDADAVQVWTAHRSKGLEFPIVYLPFLWREMRSLKEAIPYFHDADRGRCIDVGGPSGDGYAEHTAAAAAEQEGEEMRLAYVALTRARHQVVAWWGPVTTSAKGPLTTLLFAPERTGGQSADFPADAGARTVLDQLATESNGTIRIERAVGGDDPQEPAPNDDDRGLTVRTFDRAIDRAWRRTSYSAMTAAAHAGVPSPGPQDAPEHDDRGLEDEGSVGPDGPRRVMNASHSSGREQSVSSGDELEAELRAVPSLFDGVGGGAWFGTLVHAVLEHTDFGADDLPGAVGAALAEQFGAGATDIDRAAVTHGLAAAIETPLGPLAGDIALRDIGLAHRLDELHFEVPLAGGDTPVGSVSMAAIADTLAAHLPADDPLAHYPAALAHPDLAQAVHGYLSGSIDLVARIGDRYVVADYKSNWLGVDGEPLSAWHYRPAALRDAMVAAHYPLQAIIYSVALHRFLRARLADYAPDTHLGGVLYLFLRGMTGPAAPRVDGQPCGVFAWHPPAPLIVALSDVFDRGQP